MNPLFYCGHHFVCCSDVITKYFNRVIYGPFKDADTDLDHMSSSGRASTERDRKGSGRGLFAAPRVPKKHDKYQCNKRSGLNSRLFCCEAVSDICVVTRVTDFVQ